MSDACNANFYCTYQIEPNQRSWYCPEGLNLAECANVFGVSTLVSTITTTNTSRTTVQDISTAIISLVVTTTAIAETVSNSSTTTSFKPVTTTTPAIFNGTGTRNGTNSSSPEIFQGSASPMSDGLLETGGAILILRLAIFLL